MRVIVQRSGCSSVCVNKRVVGSIEEGVVLLIGFTEGDTEEKLEWMAKKIANLRIFPDEKGVMNLSLLDICGSILAISQFTLYANCEKGNRPSYMAALKNEEARKLYDTFCEKLRKYVKVETGIFGADMDVSIQNIGPTTVILER